MQPRIPEQQTDDRNINIMRSEQNVQFKCQAFSLFLDVCGLLEMRSSSE